MKQQILEIWEDIKILPPIEEIEYRYHDEQLAIKIMSDLMVICMGLKKQGDFHHKGEGENTILSFSIQISDLNKKARENLLTKDEHAREDLKNIGQEQGIYIEYQVLNLPIYKLKHIVIVFTNPQ